MDMNNDITLDEQEENAHQALIEMRQTGKTTKRCLRCGGNLLIDDRGSSFMIQCEQNHCFKVILRGI